MYLDFLVKVPTVKGKMEFTERQYGTNCMQVIKKSAIFICIIAFQKKAQNG